MQKLVIALALTGASAFVAPSTTAASSAVGFGFQDLQELAEEQNPIVGYFDPLELGQNEFWDGTNEETIGFLRHAEIKHGRVAMAGFIGFCVHAQGITWGFPMTLSGTPWPKLADTPGGVPALWDALPGPTKYQIIGFVGALEFWGELQTYDTQGKREPHYMKGGLPGKYPSFEKPLPLDLYVGLGAGKKSAEDLARGRNAEINNGRLAMIGLFSLLAECVVPGSNPFLGQFGFPQYSGNLMVPFEGDFSVLS